MAKGLNAAMKSVGRNMAKANLQSGSGGVKKYAAGGIVPEAKSMGSMGGRGMDKSGFGAGMARGGKSSRGRKFSGTF